MNSTFTTWMSKLLTKKKPQPTCSECLQSLQLLVDGEATIDQEKYFRKHLDECTPCYDFYNLEKCVKEIIQKKIEKKEVPPALLQSIKEKINLRAES